MHKYDKRAITRSDSVTATMNDFIFRYTIFLYKNKISELQYCQQDKRKLQIQLLRVVWWTLHHILLLQRIQLRSQRQLNLYIRFTYTVYTASIQTWFLTSLQNAYFSIFSFPRQRLIMMRRLSSYKEFLFPFLLTKINPRGGRLPPSNTRNLTGHLLVNYV